MKEYTDKDGNTYTSEELKRKYNPEGSSLRKVQKETLKMLLWFDKICNENSLEYFLACGNVLGAVRHGGFIPWDDDIDVCMLEKDYKKLEKLLLSNKYNNDSYILQNHKTDKGYYGFWSVIRYVKSEFVENIRVHNARKYRGCQIDVFPVAEGRSEFLARLFYIPERINKKFFIGYTGVMGGVSSLLFYFEKYICIPLFKLFSRFHNKGILCHAYPNCFYYEKVNISHVYPLGRVFFEGYEFPAPGNLVGYLTDLYGEDYMLLASPSERCCHNVLEYRFF